MSVIISFVGLPASGKTFLSKKIKEKFKLPYFPNAATEVILEKGFSFAGFKLPYEFDEEVFERNRRKIEETEKKLNRTSVVWESHMIVDASYLMGRAFFGDGDPRRYKLLQKYQNDLQNQLVDKTIFVVLDLDPEASLKRQKERGIPQLMTSDLKLLKYVRESLLRFYRENKDRAILIDVNNKSKEEILKEIEKKLKPLL
jgi:thymidylate kinase